MTTHAWQSTASQAPSSFFFGVRMRSINAIWLRHWYAFVRYWKYALAFIVVEPVAMLVGVAIGVARLVDSVPGTDVSYAEFVAPGIVIGSAMFTSMVECAMGAYNRMDNQLYETQLTAPLSVFEVLIGDVAWATSRGMMSSASIVVVALAFGWINEWTVVFIVIPVVLTGILFSCIGFLFSSTAPHPMFVGLVFTVVGTPMFMFSGIFFPFEVLPDWAEFVSNFIPLAPAVEMGRALSTNNVGGEMLWDAVFLILMIAIVAPLSLFLLRRKLVQ